MKRKMLLAALTLWAGAFLVWSLGWVSALSALSLTAPEGLSLGVALLESAVVLCAWFGAVMVAPVLTLSAALWTLISHLGDRLSRRPTTNAT